MFEHRSYLGWITDLASRPHPTAAWPSIELDDPLLADYETTFATMERIGLAEIAIWGLFVAGSWPVAIESAVSADRAEKLERLFASARRHGIKVLSGLGVYSWGFQEIIAANPSLSRGNPRAMCASNPEAWEWQRRVLDFVFRWPLDGISMQSADQGRCPCPECAALGDVEYHALLNARTADYVKSIRPAALVGVNNWGMNFGNPADFPHLIELSRHVDYIIDAHDTARGAGDAAQRDLIASVDCGWGTIGGYAVEPPQHWERDRWFLPCIVNAADHIRSLRARGGSACELYFRIMANPGDEISLLTCGRLLSDPAGDWRRCLLESVREVYAPVSDRVAGLLADAFLRAEAAYFDNAVGLRRVGTLSLEPLVSDRPGEPIYLAEHLDGAGLDRYERELRAVRDAVNELTGSVGSPDRIARIVRCLDGALHDVESVRRAAPVAPA